MEFGPHRLDLHRSQLWRGGEPVRLRRKTWDTLCYLAERPGVLVSSDELFNALWPGIAVTPKVLTNVIGELRRALRDDVRAPRVIETVHRRGYRFIGALAPGSALKPGASAGAAPEVRDSRVAPASPATAGPADQTAPSMYSTPPAIFVGRDLELDMLSSAWQTALQGQRQLVIVTGEPGIGKTALLDFFVHRLCRDPRGASFVSARGQSLEHVSAPEAYHPVLEIVSQLTSASPHAAALLRRYAPMWLVQMPWLLPAAEAPVLRDALPGASPRMLREGCAFLEALSREMPMVLVLEDLQWADPATVDLVSLMGQRREPARLLLIATCRPAEATGRAVISMAHARGQRGQRLTLELSPLARPAIQAFWERRFGSKRVADRLAALTERDTAGNPLFLSAMADHLVQRGLVTGHGDECLLSADLEAVVIGVPDQLRDALRPHLRALADHDIEVLEAASVVGQEFATQAVAAGLDRPLEEIERVCEGVARRGQLLRWMRESPSPDGIMGEHYAFAHALYQRVLYEGIAPARRQRLHHRIAESLQTRRGPRVGEIAAGAPPSGSGPLRLLPAGAERARHEARRQQVWFSS